MSRYRVIRRRPDDIPRKFVLNAIATIIAAFQF